MNGWTYGVELEWPDIDVTAPLPEGWTWSTTDYTVVNSDAVANDPKRLLVLRGGELNSPPAPSPAALGEAVSERWVAMQPGYNYRSNLHIHVRIPGMEDDLRAVQRIAAFTREYLPEALPFIDPLDGLLADQETPVQLEAAKARLAHSRRSRHHLITEVRHRARMSALTVQAALAAEVPVTRNGKSAWALASREAVNLRSLRKHGTIEFRCFAAPRNAEHVYAAACFARDWLEAALHGAANPVRTWAAALPKQAPFRHHLEVGWRYTNFKHNARPVVAERLARMGVTA